MRFIVDEMPRWLDECPFFEAGKCKLDEECCPCDDNDCTSDKGNWLLSENG